MNKRRYCSVACRQRLKYQLDVRSGLLKALNARYATFYFTDTEIVLDVLVSDAMEINSFIFNRSPGKKPVEDFVKLSNKLGKVWWSEKNRTAKRYLANRVVLDKAEKRQTSPRVLFPGEVMRPARVNSELTCLKLDKEALESSEAMDLIKSAFRKMAKTHHPDQGGDSDQFRRVYDAYKGLLEWCRNPVFIRRRGFVGKWFYDGARNTWVQPLSG